MKLLPGNGSSFFFAPDPTTDHKFLLLASKDFQTDLLAHCVSSLLQFKFLESFDNMSNFLVAYEKVFLFLVRLIFFILLFLYYSAYIWSFLFCFWFGWWFDWWFDLAATRCKNPHVYVRRPRRKHSSNKRIRTGQPLLAICLKTSFGLMASARSDNLTIQLKLSRRPGWEETEWGGRFSFRRACECFFSNSCCSFTRLLVPLQ